MILLILNLVLLPILHNNIIIGIMLWFLLYSSRPLVTGVMEVVIKGNYMLKAMIMDTTVMVMVMVTVTVMDMDMDMDTVTVMVMVTVMCILIWLFAITVLALGINCELVVLYPLVIVDEYMLDWIDVKHSRVPSFNVRLLVLLL